MLHEFRPYIEEEYDRYVEFRFHCLELLHITDTDFRLVEVKGYLPFHDTFYLCHCPSPFDDRTPIYLYELDNTYERSQFARYYSL